MDSASGADYYSKPLRQRPFKQPAEGGEVRRLAWTMTKRHVNCAQSNMETQSCYEKGKDCGISLGTDSASGGGYLARGIGQRPFKQPAEGGEGGALS